MNHNVKVHFECIAFLGDQPEMKSMTHLMLGNSKFGAEYSYSVDVGSIVDHLLMCKPFLSEEKSEIIYISQKRSCNK